MLTNEELKVIIIMMKRASCTGEESAAVATVINKLDALYNAQARVKEDEGKPEKKVRDK